MLVFLIVLVVILFLFILFCFTNIKVYLEFDNVSDCNTLKVKGYIFSNLLVFWTKKKIKSESKKQSIKDKLDTIVSYIIESKADPVDFAKKTIKKTDGIPDLLKRFDYRNLYLETMNLNICLDLNNAALSAIGTGAANAILGMVTAKYADNILGPVNYKVFPGYTGNGIKLEVNAKFRVKAFEIVKLIFEKKKKTYKGGK
jgi:hypothetical protein